MAYVYNQFAVAVPMDGNPTIDHTLSEEEFILMRMVLTEWGVPFKVIALVQKDENGEVTSLKNLLVKGSRRE